MTTMHPAVQHLVLFLFEAAFSAVGWSIAHNPSKAYRFFTFGMMSVSEHGIGFFQLVGWCSAVIFALGALEQCYLIASELLH
jgi:steroid 5-alpha reductase family enzyme